MTNKSGLYGSLKQRMQKKRMPAISLRTWAKILINGSVQDAINGYKRLSPNDRFSVFMRFLSLFDAEECQKTGVIDLRSMPDSYDRSMIIDMLEGREQRWWEELKDN